MPTPSELPADSHAVRLPAHCVTVTAEDLRVKLVLAADLDEELVVDASEVESVGQAVLQLLVAARHEAQGRGQPFLITDPSPAFAHRVGACGLGDLLGLEQQEVPLQ